MLKRRQVLKMLGISATALSLPAAARPICWTGLKATTARRPRQARPDFAKPAEWQANLTLTPEDKVAGYNNFYEFGLDKADPAANAGSLRTDPWTLTIGGEVAKPLTLTMTI
jgi:sulfoxide reductase catalytic subunit YedY